MSQETLFGEPNPLPQGLRYETDFLSQDEERALLEIIQALPFHEAEYKEWRAKRRIVSYGGSYDFGRNELKPAPPIPDFLYSLCRRAADWAGITAAAFSQAIIAEYSPETPLGWHRDVPQFEDVIGVSLRGHARMRFRPYPPKPGQRTSFALELAPRSVYLLRGAARWNWQHAVSPTKELRYSITFRSRSAIQ
jgi:alkylated DNA repair dioxygenase AlkB